MKRDLDEIASLAAEVRAILESEALRGLVLEPQDLPLPDPIPPDIVDEPAPVEPSLPPASGAWSSLARKAREERPDPALALGAVRDQLHEGGGCRRCELCRDRRTIVFGVGDPDADLVVCGEAPGYHEDQRGEPFVGPAGEMLDKMLVNVLGLQRSQAYILNVVKCRPPKNRNPLPQEIEACRPFLERQLDAIQPKVVLLLGSVALGALFGASTGGIKQSRGKWLEYRGVPVMPTFHPAYLLRQPADKRLTFEDLKEARRHYDSVGGRR